jgi:hypothetical protein
MSQDSNGSFDFSDSDDNKEDDDGSDFEEASDKESSDDDDMEVGSEEDDSDAFDEDPPKKKQKKPPAKKPTAAKKSATPKKAPPAKKPASAKKVAPSSAKQVPGSAAKKAAPSSKAVMAVGKTPAPVNKKRPSFTNEKGPATKKAAMSISRPQPMGALSAAKKPSKAAPVKQITGAQASERISEYCRNANRPYSVINITDNLRKEISKPNVQKIVDDLANKGKLSRKEFGKTKVYWYNQEQFVGLDCSAESLASLDMQYKAKTEEFARVSQSAAKKELALQGLLAEPADADLESKLKELQAEVEAMRTKAAMLDANNGKALLTAADKEKMTKDFSKYRKAWVERKRMCTDRLDDLAEGLEKKRKDVAEMVGVETDEEIGIAIPPKGADKSSSRRGRMGGRR